MTKVYIVGEENYEGFDIEGVFDSEESAEAFVRFKHYLGCGALLSIREYDKESFNDESIPKEVYAIATLQYEYDDFRVSFSPNADRKNTDRKSKCKERTLEFSTQTDTNIITQAKLYFIINTKQNETHKELNDRALELARGVVQKYADEHNLTFYKIGEEPTEWPWGDEEFCPLTVK